MSNVRLVAFAGSYRAGSFNKKLLALSAEAAKAAGAEVEVVDLKALELPMYDGDLEDAQGHPKGAQKLKGLLQNAHGILIASPEYNSAISAALKNAIDWATRPPPGDLSGFSGKVVALMSASPGALGGLRGLLGVRAILGSIGAIVLPDQVTVSKAHEAFTDDGKLKDAGKQKAVEAQAQRLVAVAGKLA